MEVENSNMDLNLGLGLDWGESGDRLSEESVMLRRESMTFLKSFQVVDSKCDTIKFSAE